MGNFNLTEAAKEILGANVAAKKSGQESGVGDTKLSTSVAYGTKDAGNVGHSPEMEDEHNPDYTKDAKVVWEIAQRNHPESIINDCSSSTPAKNFLNRLGIQTPDNLPPTLEKFNRKQPPVLGDFERLVETIYVKEDGVWTDKFIIEEISELFRDKSILMVSHKNSTLKLCNKVYKINDCNICLINEK